MNNRKVILILSFALLIALAGLILSYLFDPIKMMGYASQVSNRIGLPYSKINPEPTNSTWKTYVDEKHGYSFQYPVSWAESSGDYSTIGALSSLSVSPIDVQDCTTATNYFEKEIFPYFPNIKQAPLPNPHLEGFIIEEYHLDNNPGPEAYVMNCPYVIRLGFNPTDINEGEKVFDGVISSFKTWQPSE